MFPFDLEIEELETEKEEVCREYEIDYKTGQLTGRIVEGKEAVKVWIYLTLHTDRYVFAQYSWNCGNELNVLIGSAGDEKEQLQEEKLLVEGLFDQKK